LRRLTEKECRSLSDRIDWIGDVPRVRRDTNLPTGVLVAIHTQGLRRKVISNYWKVKDGAHRLASAWKRGASVREIAQRKRFPPIVIARIISYEIGVSKNDFRKMVNGSDINRSLSKDQLKMASEVSKIVKLDYMDSPWSLDIYREVGRQGEQLLSDWLNERGLKFKTEKEQKGGTGVPTPDFLFASPEKIDGRKNVSWIESKGFFGDLSHVRRHHRRQAKRYESRFGKGMMVYWYGLTREAERSGPVDEFLDPGIFEGRDGWERLMEDIPAKLVIGATQGPKAISS